MSRKMTVIEEAGLRMANYIKRGNGCTLEFKWTTSKACDTYGYNICTCKINGVKVGQCKGGNYDMEATSLAEWVSNGFQDDLKKLNLDKYSCLHLYENGGEISVDGGFDSIMKVLFDLGIRNNWHKVGKNKGYYYLYKENEI